MKNKKNNYSKTMQPIGKTLALWVALLVPVLVSAQVRIDWQQCYGSLGADYGFSIIPSSTGFSVLGQVEEASPSGMYECNIYAPYRADWLIGIANASSPDWQNCFTIGACQKLHQAGDGMYYITGLAFDDDYILSLRVRKTDSYGNVLWTKYLGTDNGLENCADNVFGLSTPDEGIIVATTINEASGDVSHYFGGNDCWVVKLDAEGDIEWQTTLGTEGNESVTCLQEAAGGGSFLWINSDQMGNGNIGCGQSENKGVLVKLDAVGQFQWNLCFDKTSVCSLIEMNDGYLLAGDYRYNVDPNGNCGDGMYTYDCYLLRCDSDGNVVWNKDYGGSCEDRMVKVLPDSNGGFTVFTNSKSMDGDVESFSQLGVTDDEDGNIWIFHVDTEGNLQWESCVGSQLGLWEEMRDVIAVGNREYAIVGTNTWFDGVSSGLVECSNNLFLPNSESNIWVLHVTDVYDYDAVSEDTLPHHNEVCVTPNPTNGFITIIGENLSVIEVVNTLGRRVATVTIKGERITIDLSDLPAGVYFVNVIDGEGQKWVRKVVKV